MPGLDGDRRAGWDGEPRHGQAGDRRSGRQDRRERRVGGYREMSGCAQRDEDGA
ncbi:hypothetical protein ACFQYP_22635 [Nonomuraea antimicrobica]